MFRQYLIQALNLMKQNRFFSFVYILGTALAISMVMMMAIVYYIRTADIAPEVGRDRLLLVNWATAWQKKGESTWKSGLSYKTVKECYYPLKSAELSTAFILPATIRNRMGESRLRLPGSKEKVTAALAATDVAYWQVFRFTYVSGKPYTPEEFESGVCRAVLNETMAKKLFGKTDVVGQAVQINGIDYHVSGVVRDVSAVNTLTSADVWVPFTSMSLLLRRHDPEDILGRLQVCIRCKSAGHFAAVREEIEQNRKRYNTTLNEWEYQVREGQEGRIWRDYLLSELDANTPPSRLLAQYALILFIFLLVSGVNLSGLSASDMVRRIPELGLRKAFGASRATLIIQVLTENLLLTVIGGIIGLLLSFLLVFVLRHLLFGMADATTEISLSPGMLFNLPVFLISFGFCLLLNLLSAILPAWRSTRVSIVQALNDK